MNADFKQHLRIYGVFVALSLTLITAPTLAADVYPVKFTEFSFESKIRVFFTDMSFSAKEKWFVEGKCEGEIKNTAVYITDMSFDADLEVYLTNEPLSADKRICVTNIGDLPTGFWKAYRR